MVSVSTIIAEFKQLISFFQGDVATEVSKTASSGTNESQVIVFASSESDLSKALDGPAMVVVVHKKFTDQLTDTDKTILLSDNPYLAMALVGQRFFPILNNKTSYAESDIHPSAVVASTAQIGQGTKIGPNAVIGDQVVIGCNTLIGPNTTIEPNVMIGDNCHIHAQCFIAHSCELGNKVEVQPTTTVGTEGYGYATDADRNHYRIPHYGKVILEDDVHIGAGVNIDRGVFDNTVIGKGTKIDNHCHFAHNSVLGENCLITAGFIVAGSTTIGDNYVTGGRVSMSGHIQVADNVMTGAMTVVTKSLAKPGHYAGFPIQEHKDSLKTQISLPALPAMRRDLKELKRKIAELESASET
jgi:UDP-3-O-[3-hydroxymyristoyl] glucosamine N-acyltransferase